MPPKKGGTKASSGLTLTREIGPQDTKLLIKLTSDSVGVGMFSSIGLTSSQFVELGRFNFSSWKDLVKKTGHEGVETAWGAWHKVHGIHSQRARHDLPHASSHPCGPRYAGQ